MSTKQQEENENWFPEGYTTPSDVSSYMKLEDGDNNFRILSKPVIGWEYWTEENKPKRSKTKWETTPSDIKLDKDGKATSIKHFWSFLVYNYKVGAVQSFEITQATVMKALKALIENPKWGAPTGYDITINRTGKELLTKYSVVPNPHSPLTDEIKEQVAKSEIDLESIFED